LPTSREHLVRARHPTRLLDHEKDAIRAQDVRLPIAQLVDDRLAQARALGRLTDTEHETLRAVNEKGVVTVRARGCRPDTREGSSAREEEAERVTVRVTQDAYALLRLVLLPRRTQGASSLCLRVQVVDLQVHMRLHLL
jgi:hypothetical protein